MITQQLIINLLLILVVAWVIGSLFARCGLPAPGRHFTTISRGASGVEVTGERDRERRVLTLSLDVDRKPVGKVNRFALPPRV